MFVSRVLPYGQVKTIQLAGLFLATVSFIFMLRLYSRPQPSPYQYTEGRTGPWREWNETAAPTDEVAYLSVLYETYGLTREIPFFARRIRSSFKAGKRLSMTELSTKFMPHDFKRARIDDEYLSLSAEPAIKLPFDRSARPEQIDASGLLFGISTTASRLSYANFSLIRDWERWLTDCNGNSNGATLLLALHKSERSDVARVSRRLEERGIEASVVEADGGPDPAARYTDLIGRVRGHSEELARQGGPEKKFLALVDDDVFFPSMAKLLGKLSNFSPSKEFYIGAPSEKQSDWVVDENVTMTYGGGAVFITPPMADQLVQLPCLQGTSTPDEDAPWDEHIYKCVAAETQASLHILPSFYAPDDDLYGAIGAGNMGYGGGIQPLTLHHYKAWHRFEAGKGHQVTSVCGEDCFLQRFHFRDDWILVNGYTVSQYPDGVSTIPLRRDARMMSQFRGARRTVVGTRLVIDDAPRPADMKAIAWRGPKRTWRLLDSRMAGNGEVWQAYVKRKGASNSYGDVGEWAPGDAVHTDEQPSNEDSVIVLIWEP